MKKHFYLFALPLLLLITPAVVFSQAAPVWTQDITAAPDSAYMFPVATQHDGYNNVYVLATYQDPAGPGGAAFKIYLNRYNSAGALSWSLIYDHNGSGSPRGFDMAVDDIGNCYVAGGLMAFSNYKPLLIKVDTTGNVVWERDSTAAFSTTEYQQVIFRNNRVFVMAWNGIAMFGLDGTEIWSQGIPAGYMAVDKEGRSIVSVYFGNPTNLMRFDSTGTLDFADTTIIAKRITTDADNNIYLLSDVNGYELVRYDSAGNFSWLKNNFPPAPPFGDIGYEVITDYNNDVLVVGLNDTMFKFTSSGTEIWKKPMQGLDNYLISVEIAFVNFLAVAGTIPSGNGYGIQVSLYNLNGNQAWYGTYNSNTTQEFTAGLTIDNEGIYVIEDSISNTALLKFESPSFNTPVDYSLICVDSVWYDPSNPNMINVTVFNGSLNGVNYPSVQIVSPAGDTISNPNNSLSFFVHMGNIYLTYTDTITDTTIVNFSNYTFLITDGMLDTTVAIGWCNTTGISEIDQEEINIFPNPASDILYIGFDKPGNNRSIAIFNLTGALVKEAVPEQAPVVSIDISGFSAGIYFIRVFDGRKMLTGKFIKN